MVRVLDRGGKKLMTVLDPPEDRIRATEKIVRLTYIYIKYILEGRRPSPPLSISLREEEEEEEKKRGRREDHWRICIFETCNFLRFRPLFSRSRIYLSSPLDSLYHPPLLPRKGTHAPCIY